MNDKNENVDNRHISKLRCADCGEKGLILQFYALAYTDDAKIFENGNVEIANARYFGADINENAEKFRIVCHNCGSVRDVSDYVPHISQCYSVVIHEEPGDKTRYAHLVVYNKRDGEVTVIHAPQHEGWAGIAYPLHIRKGEIEEICARFEGEDIQEQAEIVGEMIFSNNPMIHKVSSQSAFTIASALRCANKVVKEVDSKKDVLTSMIDDWNMKGE